MNLNASIAILCKKTGMSRQNFDKGRKERVRREVDDRATLFL